MAPIVPRAVLDWLSNAYPKPKVDPEWLEGCYTWLVSDQGLDPTTQLDEIIRMVDAQLLQSNFADSMLEGTGLPLNVSTLTGVALPGPAVLVEVMSITDIGVSAFQLQNVRQTRIDRTKLANIAPVDGEDVVDGDEEGPVPKYPRSMLQLELSDGTTTIMAVEYRRIPELELGTTPLGFKMLLKNVEMKKGIAFLEPKTVILKGMQYEERENQQDFQFMRSLRVRLGEPGVPMPAPTFERTPFRELSEPPEGPDPREQARANEPLNRRIPAATNNTGSPSSSSSLTQPLASRVMATNSRITSTMKTAGASSSPSGTLVASTFFSQSSTAVDPASGFAGMLSPARTGPKRDDYDDEMGTGGRDDNSSDFDFGDEIDDVMLQQLDQIEQAHTQPRSTQAPPPVPQDDGDEEVVIISDDDDGQYDKENVPLPTRHVRRRMMEDDVVEISD